MMMIPIRRTICLLAAMAALLAPRAGAAQAPAPLLVTQVDTSAYPQVQVLLASPGGPLPAPADLQLSEDGRPLPPAALQATRRRAGVAVSVLIDTSRSMRGRGLPDSADRLQDARDQTVALARALDFNTDLISIFAFHREVVPVLPLSRVDGGAVANQIATAAVLGPIPEQPGGAGRRPSAADLRNDERAYSALSQALGRAIDDLTSPQTEYASIRAGLPAMQKVIVIFADSCDDTLDAPGSKTCSIPVDMQARLQDVVRSGGLSIISVGLGTADQRLAPLARPQRAEQGTSYAARFELLQLYAQQVPNSRFFELFTADPALASTMRERFAAEVIAPIIERGEQIALTYTSQVSSAGQQRGLELAAGAAQARATFQEPRVPPGVTLVSEQAGGRLRVRPEILYSQAPLAQVSYYLEGSDTPIPGEPPGFALDLTRLPPGRQSITLVATDQRGDRSARSAPLVVEVPAPPTPTALPAGPPEPEPQQGAGDLLRQFLIDNLVSLITLLLVVVLGFVLLSGRRGQSVAAQLTSRVTGMIPRLTQPLAAGPGVTAPPPDYLLVVRQGGTVGAEYPLESLNTYIGADRSLVDLVLEDPHVSGRHAAINREGDELFITDLGSTNGTFLNQARLAAHTRALLRPQDQLIIGGLTLECVGKGASPPPSSNSKLTDLYPTTQNGKS